MFFHRYGVERSMPINWKEIRRAIDEEREIDIKNCCPEELEELIKYISKEEKTIDLDLEIWDWETFHRLSPYCQIGKHTVNVTRVRTNIETFSNKISWEEVTEKEL